MNNNNRPRGESYQQDIPEQLDLSAPSCDEEAPEFERHKIGMLQKS